MEKGDRVFSRSAILDKLWELDRVIIAGDRLNSKDLKFCPRSYKHLNFSPVFRPKLK